MLLLQALCVFLLFFQREVYSESFPCNHRKTECTCKNPNDGVCEFNFDIEMLQTFTRYVLDNNGDSRGTAGSVWWINDGQWQRVNPKDTLCGDTIDTTTCTKPFGVDGYTFRSFIAVNGQIPGPTLIVPQNKLVKVNVINRLASESISIHWHGMHQRGSNWMDGVEHITQCGIPPGASFTYIFKAAQYGTHWYHSHSGAQRTDGLFGALIVLEEKNTQRNKLLKKIRGMGITNYIDSEPDKYTLSLLDWQKSNSLDLFTQIHSGIRYFDTDEVSELSVPADRTKSIDDAEIGPVPYWSGLINGRGKHESIDYINSSLSLFRVEPEKAYRFRLIGAQSLYAYRFSIEKHNLIVIATDGEFIQPKEVDYIIIHSGERYDFLLKTMTDAKLNEYGSNFMIRAVTLDKTYTPTYDTMMENSAEAILYYRNMPNSDEYEEIAKKAEKVSERCQKRQCTALNCPFKNFPPGTNIKCMHINELSLLTPFNSNDMLPDVQATEKLFFNFAFEGTSETSTINARNLQLPSAPLALLNNEQDNEKTFCDLTGNSKCDTGGQEVIPSDCYCIHVKSIQAGKSVQMVLSATGPAPEKTTNFLFAHPVHLHGHYFHVVDIQFGEIDENGKLTRGNDDINCGGTKSCTNPSWQTNDYATGKSGKIPPTAPLKDTLLIPAGGYAVVYFKSDNPGWWFLHCHIEVHQLEGMGVIINEGGEMKTKAPYGMQKCGDFSFTKSQYDAAVSGKLDIPDSVYCDQCDKPSYHCDHCDKPCDKCDKPCDKCDKPCKYCKELKEHCKNCWPLILTGVIIFLVAIVTSIACCISCCIIYHYYNKKPEEEQDKKQDKIKKKEKDKKDKEPKK